MDSAVWTRRSLRDQGFSDSAISRQALDGSLRRVSRGLYVGAGAGVGGAAVAAALGGSVALSHLSAAAAWGLSEVPTDGPHVVVAHGRHHLSLPPTFTVHQARRWSPEWREGVPVTTLPRTLVDVARTQDLALTVPMIDAALRAGLTDTEELTGELAAASRARGLARARRAVALADGRAESPLESRLRLLLVLAGLPPADLQHEVRERGRLVARVDLWYPGIVVEADGFAYHSARADYRLDRRKGQAYARLGLLLLRFSWEDVMADPDLVVATVRAALARAAVSRASA